MCWLHNLTNRMSEKKIIPGCSLPTFALEKEKNGKMSEDANTAVPSPKIAVVARAMKQTFTVPSNQPLRQYFPYMDRPVRKIVRPYDENDDGTSLYLSATEEEILYHRGALMHFLSHHKKCKNNKKKETLSDGEDTDDEDAKPKRKEDTVDKELEDGKPEANDATVDDESNKGELKRGRDRIEEEGRKKHKILKGIQHQSDREEHEENERASSPNEQDTIIDDTKEEEESFCYAWYYPDAITTDRFSSTYSQAEWMLRLALINVVCNRNFYVEEVRSMQHSRVCEDCGVGFYLADGGKPVYYALNRERSCYEKLCMDCVTYRSNLFLRLTADKQTFRRTTLLNWAVRRMEVQRSMDRLRAELNGDSSTADKELILKNWYGRSGLWDKGLSDQPIRIDARGSDLPPAIFRRLLPSRADRKIYSQGFGSTKTVTSRQLLEGCKVSFDDILSSNIPVCSGCRDRCLGCKQFNEDEVKKALSKTGSEN